MKLNVVFRFSHTYGDRAEQSAEMAAIKKRTKISQLSLIMNLETSEDGRLQKNYNSCNIWLRFII